MEFNANFSGIPVLLTIVFVVLKMTGVIAWSWLWVLSPIWISIALTVFILFLALLVGILITILTIIFSSR